VSQTVRKASNRAQEPRSQAGVGMGSHRCRQRLIGRLIASVQTADEPLGFVRVSGVSRTRGGATACALDWRCGHMRAGDALARSGRVGGRGTRPFPPPPVSPERGGHPQFFPAFSGFRSTALAGGRVD